MCFYISNNKKYTAKRNITCYKAVSDYDNDKNTVISPYLDFTYKLNKLYTDNQIECLEIIKNKYEKIIKHGYHSYDSLKKAKRMNYWIGRVIMKCIIPKGANYYTNKTDGERVSNQIIIKEIIT